MTKPKAQPLSLRAYAKRRGVSAEAVSKAIKSGRLAASVTHDARGQPKISDPALADREWDATTDYTKAPASVKERASARAAAKGAAPAPPRRPAPPTDGDDLDAPADLNLSEETAREKYWKANLAELEYREHVGELVDAKQLETDLADCFTRVRTKLLGISARARQQIPNLTASDVGTLDAFVREALDELVLDLAREGDGEAAGEAAA